MPLTEINKQYLYLLLVCIIALILRLYHIDYQSLWLDEAFTILPTNPVYNLSDVIEHCKRDQPPAYFIALYYIFKVFGYDEVYGRIFSSIIGILGVIAMFFLGKECKDEKVGFFASILTCINYILITHSQEVRFYTLLFLAAVLSFLFFIRLFKRSNVWNFIFYTLSNVLIVYTHYFGLILMLSQAVIVIWIYFYTRNNRFLIFYIVSGALTVIAYIPWVPIVLGDLSITQTWLEKPPFYKLAAFFYNYFGKEPVQTVLYLFFSGLFIKEYYKKIHLPLKNEKIIFSILIVWIILTYAIPYIRSIVSTPIFVMRYTLITLPALFIVFGIGWSLIEKALVRNILLAIIIVTSVINIVFVKKYYVTVQNTQFREAVQAVISGNQERYQIYASRNWLFNYYLRKYDYPVFARDINASNFEDELSKEKGIWILTGHDNSGPSPEQLDYLNNNFILNKDIKLHQAQAKLYLKKE